MRLRVFAVLPVCSCNRPCVPPQFQAVDPLHAVVALKPASPSPHVSMSPGTSAAQQGDTVSSLQPHGDSAVGVKSPVQVASDFVAPPLREIEILGPTMSDDGGPGLLGGAQGRAVAVRPETLERWRAAYAAMAHDAQALGIPASAIPALPAHAGSEDIRGARDLLQRMMESFLSSGL